MFIVEKEPKSIAAESYRTLRTNIQYSSFDKEYRIIVVTSAEPEEGKSTTAGNLALCMAEGDKKVMLIDCDLRKPSLHKKFKTSNLLGLSDVIIGKADLASVTHRYNKNLYLLTSGKIPPNPYEMISSKAMSHLLESLKDTFEYIIIDTPPMKVVADSQILSTKADGTILVVRAEKTKKESVKSAIDLLKNVKANIIGIVLNGIDVSGNKYYYDYEYKE